MKGNRLYWPEMTFDSTKFFFEYQMEKSGLKFTGSRGSCGHFHSLLTTTEYNMISNGRDGGRVDGTFGFISFQVIQSVRIEQLSYSVGLELVLNKNDLIVKMRTLAVLSFEAEMNIVWSLLYCKSLICDLCT